MESQTTPVTSNESVIDKLNQFIEAAKKTTPENKKEIACLLTNKDEVTKEDYAVIEAALKSVLDFAYTEEDYQAELDSLYRKIEIARTKKNRVRAIELGNQIHLLNLKFNKLPVFDLRDTELIRGNKALTGSIGRNQ